MPQSITIPLTQGKSAIIDTDDAVLVIQYRWYVHCPKTANTCYAMTGTNDGAAIRMHRLIMGDSPDPLRDQVDHINGDGLDNRRANLRWASGRENSCNRRVHNNSTSGYKGVSWEASRNKWRATVGTDDKRIFLGYYDTPEEAAHAYDSAARLVHGRFARLNFPEEANAVSQIARR